MASRTAFLGPSCLPDLSRFVYSINCFVIVMVIIVCGYCFVYCLWLWEGVVFVFAPQTFHNYKVIVIRYVHF